jgi:116 kDa U5 small nuclear ribonucleoprotein component
MAIKEAKKLYLYNTRYRVEVQSVSAGNWVLIDGIDQSINKTATIVRAETPY